MILTAFLVLLTVLAAATGADAGPRGAFLAATRHGHGFALLWRYAGPVDARPAGVPRTTYHDRTTPIASLNGRFHRAALNIFLVIVLAHWAEHIAQAMQIWVFGWSRPKARGVLGVPFPWLVSAEWLHYGYAVVMLVGFWVLRHGFQGRSRAWWRAALIIQVWHHFEHLLLLLQALTGQHLLGKPVPTSIAQLFFPRVELHLFYNAIVFVPMVMAMYLHMRPTRAEPQQCRAVAWQPRGPDHGLLAMATAPGSRTSTRTTVPRPAPRSVRGSMTRTPSRRPQARARSTSWWLRFG